MTPSAVKRVIPDGYQVYELTLVGQTPLLMSSADVDRQGDTYQAYRTLSKKRGKSQEDESRLRELEWYTRLYFDEEIGCYIPGRNIKELLRSAATKLRKGEDIKRSLIVAEHRLPLIYDGPRAPAELWATGDFHYTTMVANSGSGSGRVERTRPMFEEWSLKATLAYDPVDLNYDEIAFAVERSEKYGLGDYRPDFGAFKASCVFLREQRSDADASAVSSRDEVREKVTTKRREALVGANGFRG